MLLDIWIGDRRDAFEGSPWGAVNAGVTWTQGGLRVVWLDWDDAELKRKIVYYLEPDAQPPAPIRSGYIFTGWDKSYLEILRDTTIHAEYIYRRVPQLGRRLLKFEYLIHSKAAAPPEAPSRDGYAFIGWNADYTHIFVNTTVIATYAERTNTPLHLSARMRRY